MKVKEQPTVYFVSGCYAVTTFEYRVLQKQEQLAHYGIQSLARSLAEFELKEALAYDIVYLYRVPYDAWVEEQIHQVRARGVPLVFGTDDLIFEPDLVHWVDALKGMLPEEAALFYEGVWRYRRTLLACDAVVTSTDYLAGLARSLGKPAFVHRNGLAGELIQESAALYAERQKRPLDPERLVLGYGSGTNTHHRDLAELAPALAQVLARHPKAELHIVGPMVLPEELRGLGERVKQLPLVPWSEWPALLNTFDVNLAPLELGNPFCRGKSEIKYTEAAVMGLPTVASRIDPFEYAICDGQNGFLAGDTGEWIDKLERLLADPALRRETGETARADVLARYTPAVLGQELIRTLAAIQTDCAELSPSPSITAGAKPLVLNWLFTEPIPGSGGHTDIVRMMNLLAGLGHRVDVYVVPYGRLRDKSDSQIRDFVRRHFSDLSANVFKWTGGPLGEADAIILTFWQTAYLLGDEIDRAQIFYFVQDWEPFFYPMGDLYLRAEQTYRMGFFCITLGSWLSRHLCRLYDARADYFDLAVDHEIFYPRPVEKLQRPRVCFYARPSTPRRLFSIGVEALTRVYQRCPDVDILFYGAPDADLAKYYLPFPYTNRGILSEDELAELFSSSHVGIVLSPTNCSLVPPEMMACRCAVVDLNRETVQGVLEHEVNALLAEPTPEAIADAVVRLLEDAPLRQRLVENAYRQVQERSWLKSARKVERILSANLASPWRVLDRPRPSPTPHLPGIADLPSGQRELLDLIHAERRQVARVWRARLKNWGRWLLRADRKVLFHYAPVQPTGELQGSSQIGQTFVARWNNLHRIDVLVGTFGRRNTRDLIFHLKTSPEAPDDLARVRLNASLLRDSEYCSFAFKAQPDSSSRSYYFYLESPESIPGDAITLWAYRDVDLPEVQLYRNGRASKGQLIFGTYYQDEWGGEQGERPLRRDMARATTRLGRAFKAARLLLAEGPSGLRREIEQYRRWQALNR